MASMSITPTLRKQVTATGAALIKALFVKGEVNEALRITARAGFNHDSHEIVSRVALDMTDSLR